MKTWNRIAILAVALFASALTACNGNDGFVLNLRITNLVEGYSFTSMDNDKNPTAITYTQSTQDGMSYVSIDGIGQFKGVHTDQDQRMDEVIGKDIKGFSRQTLSLVDRKIMITNDVLAIIPVGASSVRVEEKRTYETTAGMAEWQNILAGKTVVLKLTSEANKQAAKDAVALLQNTLTKAFEVEIKTQLGKDVSVAATVQNIESSERLFVVEGKRLEASTRDIKVLMEILVNGF